MEGMMICTIVPEEGVIESGQFEPSPEYDEGDDLMVLQLSGANDKELQELEKQAEAEEKAQQEAQRNAPLESWIVCEITTQAGRPKEFLFIENPEFCTRPDQGPAFGQELDKKKRKLRCWQEYANVYVYSVPVLAEDNG